LDSVSSTLTMRSNTCGGGPSMDSKVTVGPRRLPSRTRRWAALPLEAQPPSAHAASSAAIAAREKAGPKAC
jgi:hypothetical protein